MTSTIQPVAPAAAPAVTRLGQATAIEQSRAVAQVHAAVLIAQQFPRNTHGAIAAMHESCQYPDLANQAFYSFKRGSTTVSGPSVYLARELARLWGNVDYGVQELRRDDEHGQSEMQAFAWDLQTNTRVSTVFVVPHARDKGGSTEKLNQNRDIYENNANAGARRVRECIYAVLPPWFVSDAENRCRQTIENGGGVPLPQRIVDVIKKYEDYFQIDLDRLEQQVGRPSTKWTASDVAQLLVTGASLQRGDITADEAFPPQRITADEITGTPAKTAKTAAPAAAPAKKAAQGGDQKPAEPEPAELEPAEPVHAAAPDTPADVQQDPATRAQVNKLQALLPAFGVTKREDKLEIIGLLIKQRLASSNDLTKQEAGTVIDLLERLSKDEDPARALDAVLAELQESDGQDGDGA